MIIVRLRTGHCRLRHYIFTKLAIASSAVYPGGTSSVTVEHLLQNCPTHQNLRVETCPADATVSEKVCRDLAC